MKYNTIVTFGSGQLQDFNIPDSHIREGVAIVTILVDSIARELMFKTPGIGYSFCSSYDYDTHVIGFEEMGVHIYTYEELMILRKDT